MPIVTSPSAVTLLPPIDEAVREGRPVVALETSVLVQGLPVPVNRQAHDRMSAAVLAHHAVPALTAVVHGRAQLGMLGADLERFLAREGIAKAASRDLGVLMAKGADGATTVSATLTLARAAGVAVMATGGIGGVHHDPDYDESSDLVELGRTPMVVVCAGAKSILDLPGTLERLETYGVGVVGYRCDEFPGFYTAHTDLPTPLRLDSARAIAHAYRQQRALGHPGALLVVQPPPLDHALPRDVVERAVRAAHAQARIRNLRGSAVTPFMLAAIEKETEGRSLATNVAMLEANAALAAEIAKALAAA